MENITTILSPPITEKCSNCDYRASYSRYSMHHDCPKCRARVNRFYYPRTFTTVSVSEGRYDMCSTKIQAQVCFTFGIEPKGKLTRGFVIETEEVDHIDLCDPLQAAAGILDVLGKRLYSSQRPKIELVIAHLESVAERERLNKLKHEAIKLSDELYWVLYDLKGERGGAEQ